MKKLISLITLSLSVSAFAAPKPIVADYKVDTAATKVEWIGKKVTGEHRGMINVKSGSLNILQGEIKGGTIVVDMNSMTCTDITDKETNGKFIGHMTSADFFNTAAHPEAKLVIKKSKKTDKGLEISGDLTMLGKTGPVTFTATDVSATATDFTAKSTITIDRTKWDLKYGSGSFFKGLGDKAINDEFSLNVTLSAKK